MNQGKLEVVKQEMARVNADILGITKLKWAGGVDLTQMTIISTTVGKNPLEAHNRHAGKSYAFIVNFPYSSKKINRLHIVLFFFFLKTKC